MDGSHDSLGNNDHLLDDSSDDSSDSSNDEEDEQDVQVDTGNNLYPDVATHNGVGRVLTAYEHMRLANMAKIDKEMEELGLKDAVRALGLPSKARRKRKDKTKETTNATASRRSSRIASSSGCVYLTFLAPGHAYI